MTEPVRVLHIVGAMAPGGLENFIMNLYEHVDREAVQFDFAVHARKPGTYEDRIKELGGRIYELPRLTSDPAKSLKALHDLVGKNRYDVVVRHTANALITPQLLAARKAGAFTVCHSHNETDPARVLHYCGRLLMRAAACARMACSEKAGRWMFGNLDFTVINNAIDIGRFRYSAEEEDRIREEFGLQDAHVYGHIANFRAQKNHKYLIDVFAEIARLDQKAVLLCVGDGELRPEIEAQIREKKLDERVILAGTRNDVPACMAAMDLLLLPSLFEGLPVSMIEAQAAGIPCLISDTITKEVEVTENLISYEPINEDPRLWAERAVQLAMEAGKADKNDSRIQQKEAIAAGGYDIDTVAQWYTDFLKKHRRA